MNDWNPWSRWGVSIFSPRVSRPDPWLLMAVAGLAGIGLIMVFNASYFYALNRFDDPYFFLRKQLFALVLGGGLLAAALRVRVRWLERAAYFLMIVAVILLVVVLVVGVVRGGARRWLPLGPILFQPSELAKVALVFYLARSLVEHRARIGSFWRGVVPHLPVVGLVAAWIAVQQDFATALILCAVMGVMLYGGGARLWHLGLLAVAAVPVVAAGIWVAPYRLRRVLALLDPMAYREDTAFQLVQSMIAFGSGGLTGAGLGQGDQKMGFLPEVHTDFIFALVGEDLGVFGAIFVLGLFAVIAVRGFRIAARHPDPFASLLAFGLTSMLLIQAGVNIGVAIGLFPTTGLALPFVSYGGSALIIGMLQVGILAALSRLSS